MADIRSKQVYSGQTFRKLEMAGEWVSESNFEECVFERCVFSEATFSHCRFVACKFKNCDLSNVKWPNCRFSDAEFTDSKLVGIDWTSSSDNKADRMMFSVSFDSCVLDYGIFYKLPVKRMSKCSAREVDLAESILEDADCRETDFEGARFDKTDLTGANFVGAKSYVLDVRACKVKKARFSYPEAAALLAAFDVVVEY